MKSFIQLSKAWYAKANLDAIPDIIDEITINVGDDVADVVLVWKTLNNSPACKLEMFDDSWKAFKKAPELFKLCSELADKNISPEQMCKELTQIGFKNKTQTKAPKYKRVD